MDKDDNSITTDISHMLENLQQQLPETLDSFSQLSATALKESALDKKTKNLIALAIAIIQKSEECMAFHLQTLIKQSLNYNELLEVISVATYMGGGPALVSGQNALKIFQKLSQADHTKHSPQANTNTSQNKSEPTNFSSIEGYQ